jgi:tetratricopeptide (TPR) repeat protein
MNSPRLSFILKLFLFISSFFLFSCSFHYDQGLKLEQEKRWSEAAIEYRIAAIEDPDNEEIQKALTRMNILVAEENFEMYKHYLKQQEFHKAYRRLETALSQNPEHIEASSEMKHWWHLLITGKVELEFSSFSTNLRLAEEMALQVMVNTPKGKILTGIISSETGIFFLEDVVYQAPPQQLAEYSINTIGLKIKRKSIQGYYRNELKKFVNFRKLSPLQVSGWTNNIVLNTPQNVLDHRPALLTNEEQSTPWNPPRLVSYELRFAGDLIKVISDTNRSEFAPSVLYLNKSDRRANIDFGVYILEMNGSGRKWSIRRKNYSSSGDDYFYGLSRNLSLNRYFYYDRVFRFMQ